MKIDSNKTQTVVIDIQEKLFPLISNPTELLKNCSILIKGLKLFDIPFTLNEQYPRGLGSTIEPIRELLENQTPHEKVTFSCCETQNSMNAITKNDREFVIVFGIEAHICIMQSVLDLLEAGFKPLLVTDCIASRNPEDKKIAIDRMVQAGALPTTYESLLFELCGSSKNSMFKEISNLIK